MTQNRWVGRAFGISVVIATAVTPAWAQPLGTFRWQTQPFCNVLTLAVTGTAAGFRMEGTDDQCGGTPASAIGVGYLKADGNVGVGLTLVFASAVSLHIDATIMPGAGFNGSWSDSVGRAGTFLFTPASIGGPLRPVVAPVAPGLTYGSIVAQPAGGSDKGVSATVSTDTGTPNDAAGLYGRFGGDLAFISPAPAGVRGDSTAHVGVMGLTDTGFAVVGGAGTGTGVQGYATSGANSIAVQAVHVSGGTALDVRNGALMVSGTVRAAFVKTIPLGFACLPIIHELLDGDPDALVFVTPLGASSVWARYDSGIWQVCRSDVVKLEVLIAVLVIKQGPG